MSASFETHQIHFPNREAFDDAIALGLYPDDIGHADLIFTFYRRQDRDEAHKWLVAASINCTADSDE